MPRGMKTCNKCGAEVTGARTKICPKCGNVLIEDKPMGPMGPTSYDTDGNKMPEGYEPRMTLRFPGGYDYGQDDDLDMPLVRVGIPSGEPPTKIRLTDQQSIPDDDSIRQWAKNVRQSMITNERKYLTNEALTYWARQQLNAKGMFSPRGDEMAYVGLVVGELPDVRQVEVQ